MGGQSLAATPQSQQLNPNGAGEGEQGGEREWGHEFAPRRTTEELRFMAAWEQELLNAIPGAGPAVPPGEMVGGWYPPYPGPGSPLSSVPGPAGQGRIVPGGKASPPPVGLSLPHSRWLHHPERDLMGALPYLDQFPDPFLSDYGSGGAAETQAPCPDCPSFESPSSSLLIQSSPVQFSLPVSMNHRVDSYLEFFLGRGKPIMAVWLARMGKYRPLIEQILEEEGMPLDLIYLAMIESGFNTKAVSRASAVGIWQFIASTGRMYGLAVDYWVDERQDPVKSTRAAAAYLKDLHGQFGSWELAMAAYNGGPGRVSRAVQRYNSNDYWEISRYQSLPREARYYVPKVIAAALIGKHREQVGLGGVVDERPWEWGESVVPGGTDLDVIGRVCGVSGEVIADLNPELRRGVVPPDVPDYTVRIPPSCVGGFYPRFLRLQGANEKEYLKHQVKFGETVRTIAGQYRVPIDTVRVFNQLEAPGQPEQGQVLVIPVLSSRVQSINNSRNNSGDEQIPVVVPALDFRYEGRKRIFFQVPYGYSIHGIGEHFGVDVADVAMWNGLDVQARLQRGMVLQLFVADDFEEGDTILLPAGSVKMVQTDSEHFDKAVEELRQKRLQKEAAKSRQSTNVVHTVRRGEMLGTIARKYGVTVNGIVKANKGLNPSRLQVGQKIIIPRR